MVVQRGGGAGRRRACAVMDDDDEEEEQVDDVMEVEEVAALPSINSPTPSPAKSPKAARKAASPAHSPAAKRPKQEATSGGGVRKKVVRTTMDDKGRETTQVRHKGGCGCSWLCRTKSGGSGGKMSSRRPPNSSTGAILAEGSTRTPRTSVRVVPRPRDHILLSPEWSDSQ
jgi:hypothetical protein